MRSRHHKTAVLLCSLALFAQELSADNFRCGRKLVSVGDSAGGLARACGEPKHKDRGRATIRVGGVAREASVERWYYKKSSRSLEYIVIVHNGRVAAVELGHR